ncbi:serine/threonine protein kinase [Spirosoma sp. KCTC 42546]|uniref:serine/threonine protein kinase n=1 Tax=Spirosoma sp. KCTC 42546 TaxID=2520506 RepID=UPI00115A8B1A|nr:serine/threonine-protein kinase [Spirosoma sp. KCTC 42546]QDK81966.1 serine/threonine protein kinase [Spirosoma sp. KCTC 42546]
MSTIRFDTRFPGYEVLSELGRSNARILKARHLATGDLVAIKHFALNTDAETLRRFQRESAIMTSIAHPNVVKVREVQLEAELPYVVMELIEGGNLHQLIAGQGQLDVPTTIRLGLQMASAFKAIHPQGIVHRDIKPENILFRPLPSGELHFLLTDFGVARLHEHSNTMTGQSLMTYEYASPEQFNDPKGVGVATDYYSLGVVLYECLHGSVPFTLDDHTGIVTFMNKVLTEAPPALTITTTEQYLSAFAELLQGLLQKKAADRLSDPDELTWLLKQAELNYLQANRATSTRPSTPEPMKAVVISEPVQNEVEVVNAVPEEAPVVTSVPSRGPRKPTRAGINWPLLVVVLLLGGIGLYYAILNQKARNPTALADTPITNADTSGRPDLNEETAIHQREAEEAIQREQLRQEALAAVEGLTVKVNDYRVGLFGGIKNVQLQLTNPSQVTFSSVAVKVNYYKESGGLYKSEKVYFRDIGPKSSLIETAPNSDRGTKLTYKIVEHQFAPSLDSLMTADSTQ